MCLTESVLWPYPVQQQGSASADVQSGRSRDCSWISCDGTARDWQGVSVFATAWKVWYIFLRRGVLLSEEQTLLTLAQVNKRSYRPNNMLKESFFHSIFLLRLILWGTPIYLIITSKQESR